MLTCCLEFMDVFYISNSFKTVWIWVKTYCKQACSKPCKGTCSEVIKSTDESINKRVKYRHMINISSEHEELAKDASRSCFINMPIWRRNCFKNISANWIHCGMGILQVGNANIPYISWTVLPTSRCPCNLFLLISIHED